ncbi:MAG TPA: glycosyltransferase family 2 protein [Pseudogracilibacillus sp.]|nr:glycosyltransferase family 2 protein [Pseudogracilibacillus sp.]
MVRLLKKIIAKFIDFFLYTLLSEKQRERLANTFSDRQKEAIKRFAGFGKRHEQKRTVKHIKDHLYSLGLRKKALADMTERFEQTQDAYKKRLYAWELALWYANQLTERDAKQALVYIEAAKNNEKDRIQRKRIAVLEAECLQRVGDVERARRVLEDELATHEHPDLFLGLANLETDIEKRLAWINRAFKTYNLHPITFTNMNEPTYNDLAMERRAEKVKAKEKVSVILPAYNAEDGIHVAIESILAQTWQNVELFIVDDCSTDQTYDIAKTYAAKDERVHVLQTPQNSGPYIARNIALQQATGTYVTVNDADDWSHEKKLEIQARHLNENPTVIANTSAHARLTEDLSVYRRGTPGRYIFPNMSSIMFRRKEVLDKIGYWDCVRFAADGEFKRRLLRAFGTESYVDLHSGPLSLPRQSVSSLTSSSAFGYNGFFMGVRKEYVESIEHYYERAESLRYDYPTERRPFPVPEPMWPTRERKDDANYRTFDIVLAADFRAVTTKDHPIFQTINDVKQVPEVDRIGLVQLYTYDLDKELHLSKLVRDEIDGEKIQMLVYGEKINTEKLLVIGYNVLLDEQTYVPTIQPDKIALYESEEHEDVQKALKTLLKLYDREPTLIKKRERVQQFFQTRSKERT